MANQIVWCDIPVSDLDRAVKFYSAVLGQDVKKHDFPGMTVGVLPHGDGEAGGCLLNSPDEKPSAQGVMIYLNVNGDSTTRSSRSRLTAARSWSLNMRSGRSAFARLFSTAKEIASRCIQTSVGNARRFGMIDFIGGKLLWIFMLLLAGGV